MTVRRESGDGYEGRQAPRDRRVVDGAVDGAGIGRAVEEIAGPVVEAVVPGGIYVDLPALLSAGASREIVRGALAGVRDPGGTPLIVDAFHSYAVALARYC